MVLHADRAGGIGLDGKGARERPRLKTQRRRAERQRARRLADTPRHRLGGQCAVRPAVERRVLECERGIVAARVRAAHRAADGHFGAVVVAPRRALRRSGVGQAPALRGDCHHRARHGDRLLGGFGDAVFGVLHRDLARACGERAARGHIPTGHDDVPRDDDRAVGIVGLDDHARGVERLTRLVGGLGRRRGDVDGVEDDAHGRSHGHGVPVGIESDELARGAGEFALLAVPRRPLRRRDVLGGIADVTRDLRERGVKIGFRTGKAAVLCALISTLARRAIRAGGSGRALRSLFALDALRTLRAFRTGVTLRSLRTFRASCARRAGLAGIAFLALRALLTLRALKSLRTLLTLRAGCTGCTGIAFFTGVALFAGVALRALDALLALRTLRTLFTLRALDALYALRAAGALRALQCADARPCLVALGPDVELSVRAHLISACRAGGESGL